MKPVSPVIPNKDFPEGIGGKDQPEYQPLPFVRLPDGIILTRWELSDEEKAIVVETGNVYLYQWNGNKPITPILLKVETPELR